MLFSGRPNYLTESLWLWLETRAKTRCFRSKTAFKWSVTLSSIYLMWRRMRLDGLLVEYVERRGAQAVMRGLRAVSDFEFEFQLALMNRKLNERVETIFMMPKDTYTFLSSRIVKEIASLGGDVSAFVPAHVRARFGRKIERTCRCLRVFYAVTSQSCVIWRRMTSSLEGEMPAEELDLDTRDELIQPKRPFGV